MNYFYYPHITPDLILPEEESKHCIKVLRMQEGDTIYLIDGKGGFYEGAITKAHPKKCEVHIGKSEQKDKQWDFELEIGIAPPKNINRFEWFIEKSTEIGIDTISPFYSFHSERRNLKTNRLEKVMLAAVKQSVKYHMPVLNEPVDFKNYIKVSSQRKAKLMIATCIDENAKPLQEVYQKGEDTRILIGPEGDFSEEELRMAFDSGYQSINLGQSRLRLETAGIVACHSIHLLDSLK